MLFQSVEKEVRKETDVAVQQAKTDPEPPLSELTSDIYSQPLPGFSVRKCDAFSYDKITA